MELALWPVVGNSNGDKEDKLRRLLREKEFYSLLFIVIWTYEQARGFVILVSNWHYLWGYMNWCKKELMIRTKIYKISNIPIFRGINLRAPDRRYFNVCFSFNVLKPNVYIIQRVFSASLNNNIFICCIFLLAFYRFKFLLLILVSKLQCSEFTI